MNGATCLNLIPDKMFVKLKNKNSLARCGENPLDRPESRQDLREQTTIGGKSQGIGSVQLSVNEQVHDYRVSKELVDMESGAVVMG